MVVGAVVVGSVASARPSSGPDVGRGGGEGTAELGNTLGVGTGALGEACPSAWGVERGEAARISRCEAARRSLATA